MRRLVWRARAREDVAAVITFIAEHNPAAARRLRNLFDEAVRHLPAHPFMFRQGRVEGSRELVAHPNYILVYRVTPATVEIVALVHARQRYP